MIRTVLTTLLLLPALLESTLASPAVACTPAVPQLTEIVRLADTIALVEVLAVGGAENSLPTLVSDPTVSPALSAESATRSPTLEPKAASSTPSATSPALAPYDLTGIGATVRIVETYLGTTTGIVELDSTGRLNVERRAREVEVAAPGVVPICPIDLGVTRFAPTARYLVFTQDAGNDVLFALPLTGEPPAVEGEYIFYIPRSPALSYVPGQDLAPDSGDSVLVRAARLPLSTLIRLIHDLRGDPAIITPPQTGTAGLR